jgi:predicted nucleic acid-binding protein
VALVLDACAVIAYLRGEPGAQVVKQLLLADADVVIHAANLCEVYYDFVRAAGTQAAENAIADVAAIGVQTVEDMDLPFLRDVGQIKANNRVSFADCFAIALSRRRSADVVTSDRTEFEPIQQAGICGVTFIR